MPQNERMALVQDLAQSFGSQASAKTVYGQPIEKGNVIVIPISKVRYGLGGGSGSSKDEGEGSGGGGGMLVSPVGFIEIKDGASRFRRIGLATSVLQVVGAFAIGTWLVLRGVRALR